MPTDQKTSVRIPWTCQKCGKPLGELFSKRVHMQPRRGHMYVANYPVTATCCGCGRSNRIDRFHE